MAKKFFTFVDREVEINFFEDDPITMTMTVCDETDRKLSLCGEQLSKAGDYAAQKKALSELIGQKTLEKILDRAPFQDSYALIQAAHHITECYLEVRTKNLRPAGAGREK